MMTERAVLLLCLLNFAFIGALPRIFFRAGALNRHWWATAAPLFAMAALLLAAFIDLVRAAAEPAWPLAVTGAAMSIALIGSTIGVHRVPLALWHQDDDRAVALVRHGPYAHVRHPFYAAFLIALAAAVAALPAWWTALVALNGGVQLWRTAVREERRLRAQFGDDYAAYSRTTGMFWPRVLRRGSAAQPRPCSRT